MQKFVILGWQRTGSNMLVSALNSHPDIRCHGELLRKNVGDLRGALKVVRDMDEKYHSEEYRHSVPMQYLQAVSERDAQTPYWGFKLLCKQNELAWQTLPADRAWKSIVLYRDNLLAMYSSNMIARQARKASRQAGAPVPRKQVEFKKKQFTRFMDERVTQLAGLKDNLDKAGVDYIETRYLDISGSAGINRVAEFIGAPASGKLKPKTSKRNTSLILDRFTNPEKAERYLKEIGKEHWSKEGQEDDS